MNPVFLIVLIVVLVSDPTSWSFTKGNSTEPVSLGSVLILALILWAVLSNGRDIHLTKPQ